MRTLKLIATAGTALLLAPAASEAATWRGKTEQGKLAEVITRAGGKVDRARIRYRTVCGDGKVLRSGVAFVAPLRLAGRRRFEDDGTFRFGIGGGDRARARVSVRGRLRASGRWTGDFRVKVRITKNGRFVARCVVRKVGWTASRV